MAIASRINNHAGLIWAIADLLRGDYKQSEYGRVILPLVVLRRLDCVLEPTKDQVLARLGQLKGKLENVGPVLQPITGIDVYNTSALTLRKVLADPNQVAGNLRAWIAGFDPETRDVIEKFDFDAQVGRLDRAKLLYLVLARVTEVDLHPDKVSNVEMGYLYEELVRRFSELSNETAGEHFTPREVIRLMVDLLFIEDDDALRTPGIVRTMLDPACGTGGMLSVAQDYLRELNPRATLRAYGQELNGETYAICRSDMMLKGQPASNIRLGNSFGEDAFAGQRYDYLLANPPFGVEWKKVEREVRDEHDRLGFDGRFGAGLPRINDGSFLFLQHMISKLKRPEEGGGRLAIVFNASPLVTGGAGSGESEIRRWIVENDWLEGIVALPDQLFYNTGISTYFWIVTNRKRPERRGKIQLLDARELFVKMRKSLGEKRKELSPEQIAEITRLYGAFEENERVKILPNESFGYLLSREDNYNRLGADLSTYLVVRPGDVVFNRLRTWQGGIGVSAHQGIVSPAYFVARPQAIVFPRFLHYVLRSTPYLQEFTRISKWMPPAQFDIAWEDLRDVPIWLPPMHQQRAIADYLDAETARIDAIISARRRQLALMREHADAAVAEMLRARRASSVPLRRIVDLLAGFSYRTQDFRTDGGDVRLLRGINVDVGRIRWDECIWVSESIAQATSRFSLASGDLVLGMDRPVITTGVRVARVTAEDLPAMLVQRVARLRARPEVSQDYLYLALLAPGLAAHFEPSFTGVSVPHVSPDQILAYQIPVPSQERQEEVIRAARAIMDEARQYEATTKRQVKLLAERREALVTAAVTGQLDASGVAA